MASTNVYSFERILAWLSFVERGVILKGPRASRSVRISADSLLEIVPLSVSFIMCYTQRKNPKETKKTRIAI